MNNISEYSERFLNITPEAMAENIRQLNLRIEKFRLKIDLQAINPFIKGPDVLDFPIGTGRIYPTLMDRYTVWGYDICPPYLDRAKARYPEIADRFKPAKFEDIPYDHKFDTVITLRALHGAADPALAAKNVAAILKPGAHWIFSFPPSEPRGNEIPEIMAEAGLTLVHCKRYDVHAAWRFEKNLGNIGTKLYDRFRMLVEAKLIPYAFYRLLEACVGHRGTMLWVFKKPE